MNMQNLMAQAQRMQRDIQKKQEEINNTEFEGKSEGFTVVLNGKKDIVKLEINRDVIKDADDFDALEDMIKIAFNDAHQKINAETEAKLGAFAKGLNGLM